jgi:hypothetical protein
MVWYDTFDSIFWLGTLAAVIGCFGAAIKYCVKAKCNRCRLCCGLLEVERDIEAEVREDMAQIEAATRARHTQSSVALGGTSVRGGITPRRGSGETTLPGGADTNRSTFFTMPSPLRIPTGTGVSTSGPINRA